jgi:hypothetical protein
MKVKQWRDHIASLESLCTPQYTHLPCVIKYLRIQASHSCQLNSVHPDEIKKDITMFCNTSRRLEQLLIKIERLEDIVDA